MPDFGFVGPSYIAQSIYQDDQETINWFPEIDPVRKERGVIALYPTPGLVTQVTPQVAPVRALYSLPGGGTLLAVVGNTLYSIDQAWNPTAVSGTLKTSAGPVSIKDNGVSAYLADGTSRYFYTYSPVGSLTATSDGGFANGNVVEIQDGYLLYNDPNTQTFGCTSQNAVTSPALSFGTKFSNPDNIMSLQTVNRNVHVIGEVSTDVFVNTGAFPFPFQIIPGTTMQHGTIAQFSVARLGESFAMLSRDTRGNAVVVVMKGFSPVRISTHAQEQAFSTYAVLSDAIGMSYQKNGHEFYMLTFPTQDITWVYDLATEMWHKRAYRDANNVLHRHRANCIANFNGQIVVGDYQNGKIYTLSDTTYTDAGMPIPCIRRCPHLTQDLKRVYFHDLQIQFQPGVGLQTGQGSNPQAMLTWSDDGGSMWSKQHWASIGKVGKYKNRARWQRLGVARDRIFQVEVSDPVYRVVVSANLNASEGAS